MVAQTVSHYKILEKLGEGGMSSPIQNYDRLIPRAGGVVYKAEDTKLRRSVALKFLPSNLTQDQQTKIRFLHEARAASALDHLYVCNIHALDEPPDCGGIHKCRR